MLTESRGRTSGDRPTNQLSAQDIVDIAAVTAHYDLGDRTGASLLAAADSRPGT